MWIIFVLILLGVVLFYNSFLKDYVEVNKVYDLLTKTLDTRDLLVLKIAPEIKDKNLKSRIVSLIDTRMKNKKAPYNDVIRIDVELNKELKNFYNLINKKTDNPVVKTTFTNIIELEKKLKGIRAEYNFAVEKYNMNLVMHKFVCMRLIHMKPLDTYKVM